jgi:ATP-dependent RNA helicase DDX51/DBP6
MTSSHLYSDAVFPSPPLMLMPMDVDEKPESSCQKLLFSATLTRDPGKIALLDLRDPKYFLIQSSFREGADGIMDAAMAKYSLPAGLKVLVSSSRHVHFLMFAPNYKEHLITCEPSQKPLMLMHLIHNCSLSNALVFTKSTESTTRLVKLVEFFEDAWAEDTSGSEPRKRTVVHAYSSDLKITDRKAILQKFKTQDIQM